MKIGREITNTIRFFLDGFVPAIIRDNKYFMLPFFKIWFKRNNIHEIMELKTNIHKYSKEEMEDFYRKIITFDYDRPTGLNMKCYNFIIKNLMKDCKTVIDVGCGNGYLIQKISELNYNTTGCDVFKNVELKKTKYVHGNVVNLPFEDKTFDIVICTHTLEHILDLNKAISELKRIAKKQLIIVVPSQRYFYYTLDTHVHFFVKKEILENIINMENHVCKKLGGDLAYIGYL